MGITGSVFKGDRLQQLSSELARLGVIDGGLPPDPNKRLRFPHDLRAVLKVYASTEAHFDRMPLEGDKVPADVRPSYLKTLKEGHRILAALRQLERRFTTGFMSSSSGDLLGLLHAATRQVREIVAMLSLTVGTKDYYDLGFSADVRPTVEPSMDGVETLFDDVDG